MNPDCPRIRDYTSDAISGILPEADERALREHLDGCADCRRYAETLKQQDAILADHFARIDADMPARRSHVLRAIDAVCEAQQWNVFVVARGILTTPLTRIAAAILIVVTILALWQMEDGTTTAYALSDVPKLLGQARTIHLRRRHFPNGQVVHLEDWWDSESGGAYHYWEWPEYKQGPNGLQSMKASFETVKNGRFIMEVDHQNKTVRFERLLPVEQKLQKHLMAKDVASIAVPGVFQYLDRYTKIGTERIEAERYDVWRQEYRDVEADIGIRFDVWLSRRTGEIGRTRRWENWHKYGHGWQLASETDKIELDAEPPAGLFATEPPVGYTMENTKDTADITGAGFRTCRYPEGCEMRVPFSLALEEGSVLICWNVVCTPSLAPAEAVYDNLTFGGPLPQPPAALCGLMSISGGNRGRYGSVAFWDENAAFTITHYVGRYLMQTRKADRVYVWALYTPQEMLSSEEPTKKTIAVIEPHVTDPNATRIVTTSLTSWVVTRARFAEYLTEAMPELSEDPTLPDLMAYDSLLQLAVQVRNTPGLYDDFRARMQPVEEGMSSDPRPAEASTAESIPPEMASGQVKEVVHGLFAAMHEGRTGDAMEMLKNDRRMASRVAGVMSRSTRLENIRIEDTYVQDNAALAVTSTFKIAEGQSRCAVISLRRDRGTWSIQHFTWTTAENHDQEIGRFLRDFPKATHFSEEQER